jgi:hypothetical protein
MKTLLTPYKVGFTKVRIGRRRDGGYILLKEPLESSAYIYSYGVGKETSFDAHCARIEKQVFMYDHTIQQIPHPGRGLVFFKSPFSKEFIVHINENGHSNVTNMALKVDVEGAEWDGFLHCDGKVFNHFTQIVVEMHDVIEDSYIQKKTIERLLSYYTIVHIHGNNFGRLRNGLPQTLEISFLRNDCIVRRDPEDRPYPIHGLDFPNRYKAADYSLNWWLDHGS